MAAISRLCLIFILFCVESERRLVEPRLSYKIGQCCLGKDYYDFDTNGKKIQKLIWISAQ